MKFLKLLIGLALLPACAAVTQALLQLLTGLGIPAIEQVPIHVWWLFGGFVFWIAIFFSMPRPIRTYVLAHELTHALWGMVMGARVSRLRVSKSGGSVTLSKSNILIALAPYFFPFYTVLVLVAHYVIGFFFDMSVYEPFWLALVGFTWGFHLTFTATTLMQQQPDIMEHGRIFSYALIYILNLAGIGLWVAGVTPPTVSDWGHSLVREGLLAYTLCWDFVRELFARHAIPAFQNLQK